MNLPLCKKCLLCLYYQTQIRSVCGKAHVASYETYRHETIITLGDFNATTINNPINEMESHNAGKQSYEHKCKNEAMSSSHNYVLNF